METRVFHGPAQPELKRTKERDSMVREDKMSPEENKINNNLL